MEKSLLGLLRPLGRAAPARSSVFSVILFICASALTAQDEIHEPLTLEECVRSALQKGSQAYRIDNERIQNRTTLFNTISHVLPLINLSANLTRNSSQIQPVLNIEDEDAGEVTIIDQDVSTGNLQTSVTIVQPLVNIPSFIQLSTFSDIKRIAQTQYRRDMAELAFNVIEQFYTVVAMYNNVAVAKAAAEQMDEQVRIARESYRLGAIPRPELLRIEVGAIQQRVEMINAQESLENGRNTLAGMISVAPPATIDTTLVFPDLSVELPSYDSLLQAAFEANPSFILAEALQRVGRNSYKAAKYNILPVISGTFSYGYSAPDVFGNAPGFQDSDHGFWSIGAQLSWNIFDRLNWYSQKRNMEAQARIAEANVRSARTALLQESELAYTALRTSREALKWVPELLTLAEEELRLTREQFRLGVASSLDLLQSQVSYNQSRQQTVTAVIDYYIAEARFERIMGQWIE
ncbi:MAG: TolC family protein [Chitinispirillales bacterium]|jgi:outer membrane protein TolC|nr:TolC family protein [Chitinispirillales bacterium]